MVYKYFVQFDEEGEIGCFCKSRPEDCDIKCTEYIVRLTPIKRNPTESMEELTGSMNELAGETTRLVSQIKKAGNKLRRNLK